MFKTRQRQKRHHYYYSPYSPIFIRHLQQALFMLLQLSCSLAAATKKGNAVFLSFRFRNSFANLTRSYYLIKRNEEVLIYSFVDVMISLIVFLIHFEGKYTRKQNYCKLISKVMYISKNLSIFIITSVTSITFSNSFNSPICIHAF